VLPIIIRAGLGVLALAWAGSATAFASEEVGQAVLIKTAVTGEGGELEVRSPVHRDERIRTSITGLGQFVFRDNTKLAVGWGSSVVIDRFVFNDETSVKKFTVSAAKGTFRWISGNSDSSAYDIVTPAGTLGVRGTAFDFYVGQGGLTAVLLLNGAARFCPINGTGCKELTHSCEVVIATPRGGVTDPRRADPGVLAALGGPRDLPFLTGNQELTNDFRANDRACRALLAGWTKIGPESPLPNDLKQGDDIDFNVGSGAASGQRAIIAVGQLNGETRYFTAIVPGDTGWHRAITAYRRNGDKGPPPWPVPQ
jgi:hypothetical protein